MAGARGQNVDWLKGLFDAVDSQDTERFLTCLSPDAEFRFGSAASVRGREQIFAAVDGFFSSIAGSSHRLVNTLVKNDVIVCEGEVTYERHDGSKITLPFVNLFDMAGDLIDSYRIYIDIGPLYAE